ncbi:MULTISPECIES: DMT family transporter [unclassified Fusibacter]|uniref:DMT family transporter n=1 Tax=unclassified Fusibacter TaxID=2624464 RepID=UPI001011B50A|nr:MULTISPECIES: DMT family transporter [unclassified Fusibacter]MCK8061089.1 DMT family transporter [Fusibacter sp. A2]NPE23375.1 DMT family transporter [Fusibacter sp. A1]RXV59420.1 DMT family transporter [Fusibacter sp. A1]
MESYIGQLIALATAFCWSITATAFEDAGKRMGSQALNLIRLVVGLAFLSTFTLITRGQLLPFDASLDAWKWLLLSGFVGFVIGDLFLFEAFVRIGARISMLIYASVPPLNAILAYFILKEPMTMTQIIGMMITLLGIATVILVRGDGQKKVQFSHPVTGILFAFAGALGQAVGFIIGKIGMGTYSAFASTQIRIIAGIAGFLLIYLIRGNWSGLVAGFKHKKAMVSVTIGSFFGPFLGVSFSLLALQYTHPGVASTLMSITPILLIPIAIFYKKEKVHLKEMFGAFITIIGVGFMFI